MEKNIANNYDTCCDYKKYATLYVKIKKKIVQQISCSIDLKIANFSSKQNLNLNPLVKLKYL